MSEFTKDNDGKVLCKKRLVKGIKKIQYLTTAALIVGGLLLGCGLGLLDTEYSTVLIILGVCGLFAGVWCLIVLIGASGSRICVCENCVYGSYGSSQNNNFRLTYDEILSVSRNKNVLLIETKQKTYGVEIDDVEEVCKVISERISAS